MNQHSHDIRAILHLDMDAFYASVEQHDRPELKGRPVIVGGSLKRGVVSAASYEARRFGVHSAMPMTRALRLCPHAAVLPVRMKRYAEVSGVVFGIFRDYTPLVEPLSLDEAFLDVSASLRIFGPAVRIAEEIRARVRRETGLTVSAGIAPNKFLAKIASDMNKPDGLTVVEPDGAADFLGPLPVAKIWGVGAVGQETLRRMGVRSIGDLGALPEETLAARFGSQGRRLWELARGIDSRPVEPGGEPKSLGHEDTYERDLLDRKTIETCLLELSERVARRLRREGYAGGTVTLKVKYADFTTVTRSRTLAAPTDDGGTIHGEILRLLRDTDAGRRPVRLLGVSLSRLRPKGDRRQPSLFEEGAGRQDRLNAALDELAGRFGTNVVVRSALLEKPEE